MYIIYQNKYKVWVLRLNAKGMKREHFFNKYINALDAVQVLQLHINKYDKRGQVLRKVG